MSNNLSLNIQTIKRQISIFAALMNSKGKIISKIAGLRLHIFYMVIIMLAITNSGYCQSVSASASDTLKTFKDSLHKDSLRVDTLSMSKDSLSGDSLGSDSSKNKSLESSLGIRISKDALPAVVKAEAEDSAVMDMKKNKFYLYGKSQVNYQEMQLNAGKIIYDQSSNLVDALPSIDTSGNIKERPAFAQGKEKFTYDSLLYNFKSKRAKVHNVRTQYGEGYMFSKQVKRNPDQSVYAYKSVYTTCALDTPHFGIVARKVKVIPGHIIACGPANIMIEGVPTPLFLPFGLFPVSQTQKSGFVLPAYTVEEARGLGLTGGGYYFYLNDHADLLMQSNIYTKGSYLLSGLSNYSDIYHYHGNVFVSYASNKTGENFEPGATTTNDFILRWTHSTDPKAKPGENFNVSVNAGTSTYYSNNSYDPNQILQNQLSSNISYSKNWIGTPFSLTVSALHNQNTQTRQVNVTLPSLNFHVTQINPFQSKKRIGTHWYDKITTSYTLDMQNRTTFYDSAFSFNTLDMKQFQNGVHHSIPISASYTVLRFINMSFSVNYNEYWNTRRIYQGFDQALDRIDTIADQQGFYASRDFNAGVQFSTRIYGMKTFKSGRLKGIRHVMTPSVGFTYRPDFANSPFNYYYQAQIDSYRFATMSPYQNSIIGYPPSGKQGLMSMALNNNLQIKVRSSKDTVTGYKNVTLIDGFSINTAYNAAVDSFQWSDLTMSFRTNVMDKVNISANADYDAYALDYATGQRLRETVWDQGTGLARFKNASLALGSNFHSKPLNSAKNPSNSEEYNRIVRNAGYNDYVDLNIPWSINFSYALSMNNSWLGYYRDTTVLSHNITFQGDCNLTERWKLTFSSSYNFTTKELGITSIDIYRDLHCWQMHLQAIPFGPRKSYNFTLNVKASTLQDLKLMRRRDFRDAAQ